MSFWMECKCNVCGEQMDFGGDSGTIYIDPCDGCLTKAREQGHEEGFGEGEQNAKNEMEDSSE